MGAAGGYKARRAGCMQQTLVVPDPLADLARLEGVPSAVESARASIDAVLVDRGPRSVSAEVSAAALLAGAKASAELSDDPPRWRPGTTRLATEMLALSALVRVAPGQALARAHALVVSGTVPAEEVGKVSVSGAAAERLVALHHLLATPTAASGIVLGAVAHAELATMAPFGLVDDILGRAVEHLVLIATGVDPSGVVVPEAGHLAARSRYRRLLTGYASGSVTGVRDWLLHCAQALARGAEESPLATGIRWS